MVMLLHLKLIINNYNIISAIWLKMNKKENNRLNDYEAAFDSSDAESNHNDDA